MNLQTAFPRSECQRCPWLFDPRGEVWQRENQWRNTGVRTEVKNVGVCERLTRDSPGALEGRWGMAKLVGLLKNKQTNNHTPVWYTLKTGWYRMCANKYKDCCLGGTGIGDTESPLEVVQSLPEGTVLRGVGVVYEAVKGKRGML